MTNSSQGISYGDMENSTQEIAYGDISSFNRRPRPQPVYVAQRSTPVEQQTQRSQDPVNNNEKVKVEEVVQPTDFRVKPKQVHKTLVVYYQGKNDPASFLLSVKIFGSFFIII